MFCDCHTVIAFVQKQNLSTFFFGPSGKFRQAKDKVAPVLNQLSTAQ
jgi:hypothetical protein